jgi:hypothetical protein
MEIESTVKIIAIDPGKTGAIAIINIEGKIIEVLDMPLSPDKSNISERGLREIFNTFNSNDFAALEDTKAMEFTDKNGEKRDQSVSSMLNFGENKGILRGLLISTSMCYEMVSPRKWQSALNVKGKVGGNGNCIAKAKHYFPHCEVQRIGKGGSIIDMDGRADALLMAEWLRRLILAKSGSKKAA